jgi:alpha-1,6-mannosyltransferase
MRPLGLASPFQRTQPAAGPHLLDATASWNPGGGMHRVLATKAGWLAQQGWQHTLLAPGANGHGQLDCGGVPVPGTGGYRMVLNPRHAQRLIEAQRPDIVEAADPCTLAWATLRATSRLRVPAVAFCHSDLPTAAARLLGGQAADTSRRGRWAARHAQRYIADLYSQFDMVLAPSQTLARRLAAYGVQQVLVQPLGVDCSTFHPTALDPVWRARLCQRLGLHPTVRLLVYTGRFAAEKNLQLLADAVRLLGTGHALLAVGSGPHPPRGPGVHLLPPDANGARLARILASCDAYVHAGDQESFGLGALEAMACGTPTVLSDHGGLGELGRGIAITVARQDPQEWAQAISACLLASRSALREQALAHAQAHDWPVVLDQLARRYSALLRRHAGTADRFAVLWPQRAATGQRAAARMGSPAPAEPRLAPRFVQ